MCLLSITCELYFLLHSLQRQFVRLFCVCSCFGGQLAGFGAGGASKRGWPGLVAISGVIESRLKPRWTSSKCRRTLALVAKDFLHTGQLFPGDGVGSKGGEHLSFTTDRRLIGTVRVSVNLRNSSSFCQCTLRQWRRMLRLEQKSFPQRQQEIVISFISEVALSSSSSSPSACSLFSGSSELGPSLVGTSSGSFSISSSTSDCWTFLGAKIDLRRFFFTGTELSALEATVGISGAS